MYKQLQIVSGGLNGGISSTIAGGNFWQGVKQGVITSGLNHAAHAAFKGGPGDPPKKKNGDPLKENLDIAVTLDEWKENYLGMTAKEIAYENGTDGLGLPNGPKVRYVINPKDGNVMDMRHVVVVGYMKGRFVGQIVEDLQWIGGKLGNDNAARSAYKPQDYYSNDVGAKFWYYELIGRGFNTAQNMGNNFAMRLHDYLYGYDWK